MKTSPPIVAGASGASANKYFLFGANVSPHVLNISAGIHMHFGENICHDVKCHHQGNIMRIFPSLSVDLHAEFFFCFLNVDRMLKFICMVSVGHKRLLVISVVRPGAACSPL